MRCVTRRRASSLHVGYCHCRSCRHHTGVSVAAMPVFQASRVRFAAGEGRCYTSSPGAMRGSCARCGTSLTWESRGVIALQIGTLDDPDRWPPTLQWWQEEHSPWCEVAGELPLATMAYSDSGG